MLPIVHGLEAEYFGQVDFVYLDREIGANGDIVDRFGIRGQPIFVVLDSNGNEVERWFGGRSAEGIREVLDAQLAAEG